MRHVAKNLTQNGQYSRQQGMTTLGLMILVVFVGLFVYAGIRLAPAYLEDMKISGTLDKVQSEFAGQNATRRDIQVSIEKRFDVDMVNVITHRDVKVQKTGTGYTVSATYENKIPFLANVSFAVDFNHSVDIVR